jgi:hypothetical protein
MRKIIHFGKHCTCRFQVDIFSKPFFGQAVGGELDVSNLTGGAEAWAATACPIQGFKKPLQYILTLKMAL